jgi:hypothetical protein
MLKSGAGEQPQMKKFLPFLALALLTPFVSRAAISSHPTVIFDGKSTELSAPAPVLQSAGAPATDSHDLWLTLDDLTRATGFELKPQGMCRKELCFPLPSARRSEFLITRGSGASKVQWFNLSAFARMLHQPIAYDEALTTWYFGPRPEVQNNYLASFQAPNFTLPDMEGKMHSLADYRGKKVLIITWASW